MRLYLPTSPLDTHIVFYFAPPRYSFLGAMPAMEIIATQNKVTFLDHEKGTRSVTHEQDPMKVWKGVNCWLVLERESLTTRTQMGVPEC